MNTKIKANKITRGSLLIALGLLLPQIFHIFGGNAAGAMFLPMHIPVLLSGIILGPIYGLFIGGILPILSSIITGMPSIERIPLMICELACYGFFMGLFYKKNKDRKYGIYISILSSMMVGRIVYALLIVILGSFLNLSISGPEAVIYAVGNGMPGIIVQIIIIPILIKALKEGGIIDDK